MTKSTTNETLYSKYNIQIWLSSHCFANCNTNKIITTEGLAYIAFACLYHMHTNSTQFTNVQSFLPEYFRTPNPFLIIPKTRPPACVRIRM